MARTRHSAIVSNSNKNNTVPGNNNGKKHKTVKKNKDALLSLDVDKEVCCDSDKCKSCHNAFLTDDKCLGCILCATWIHVACAGMSDEQYHVIVSLGDSVEYFCPSCNAHKQNFISSFKTKSDVVNTVSENNVSERLAKLEDTVLSLIDTVKSASTRNNHVDANSKPLSYSEMVKLKSSTEFPQPSQTDAADASQNNKPSVTAPVMKQQRPALFLLGCTTDVVSDRTTFLEKFAKLFPKCKIVGTYRKASGTIVLYFNDVVNKERVLREWESHYFGTATKVVDPAKRNTNSNLSVVVKNVPKHISEASLLNYITEEYPTCVAVTRFNKKGDLLPIIKADFKSMDDKVKIVNDGFFVENIFLKAENFTVLATPIRCFNCQRFGHVSQNCKHPTRCVKCGGNHRHKDCNADEVKCCGCGAGHLSSDKKCAAFLEVLRKLNVNV